MSYIAFGFGMIVGFFLGILIISLLCMASAHSRELEEAERWERIQKEMGHENLHD